MTMITLSQPLVWPGQGSGAMFVPSSYPLFSTSDNYRLDATRTKIAIKGQVPASGNITKVVFNLQAVTTDEQVRVSLQTVDTSGLPSGTNYKSSAYGDDAISLAANTLQEITLGTQATSAVAGDTIFVVFEWASTQGDIRLAVISGNVDINFNSSVARYVPTTWSVVNNIGASVGLGYGSTVHKLGGHTLQKTSTTYNYHDSTAGADEYGNKFTLPFKCRVIGIQFAVGVDIADVSICAALFNSSRTVLASKVVENYEYPGNTTGYTYGMAAIFDTPQTVEKNAVVYATLTTDGTSTSTDINLYSATFESNAHLSSMPSGINTFMVNRLDAATWSGGSPSWGSGAFTEVNTELAPICLIIDQIDDGDGTGTGGGLLTHPGMSGGISA